jgi:4-amino-4-deoxy-L-arabinose transferase-like glycosyltransferase
VFFSHGLLTETLFLPLLVAMAYGFVRLGEAATRWMRSPGGAGRREVLADSRAPGAHRVPIGWALFVGAAMGAALLTRPVLLLFPPFLALWAWWIYRKPAEVPGLGRARAAFMAISVIILAADRDRPLALEGQEGTVRVGDHRASPSGAPTASR